MQKHRSLNRFKALLRINLLLLTLVIPLESTTRSQLFFQLKDYPSAYEEAKQALKNDPTARESWEDALKALGKMGNTTKMLSLWKRYLSQFPNAYEENHLLETLAWALIEKESDSPSPLIRSYTTYSAFLARDAKGVTLLQKKMKDPHEGVRTIAIRLAGSLREYKLQETLMNIVQKEPMETPRLAAIEAIGAMRIPNGKALLIEILNDPDRSDREKQAAIHAWTKLQKEPTDQEISQFATSEKIGMRLLACELIAKNRLDSYTPHLISLTKDYHPDIRAKALWCLGFLRSDAKPHLKKSTLDTDPKVGIHAAWALTLIDPKEGMDSYAHLFNRSPIHIQRECAASLSQTGKYGLPLSWQLFNQSNDLYVRANLALGFIKERVHGDAACDALTECLKQEKGRLCFIPIGSFSMIAPDTSRRIHHPFLSAETEDAFVRLEILNLLAIMNDPRAKEMMKSYLKHQAWGISAMTSLSLISHENESILKIVEELLLEPNHELRIQAALVLAMIGKQEIAVPILQKEYHTASRELKERILEGLGKIGTKESIPFLTDRLQEPSLTLKIIAASSLLACLYH